MTSDEHAPAGGQVGPDLVRGRLLVATPGMTDPNFGRTVLLVVEHSDEGALAVVLNRPSGLEVADPLPAWGALAGEPAVVFVGGPVSPDAALVLVRVEDPGFERWAPVFDDVGVLDVALDPSELGDVVHEVRIFAGYAGWAPGQLEGEIAAGAWFVVDASVDDVLTSDPVDLWAEVLARAGGDALFAAHPPQPWLS